MTLRSKVRRSGDHVEFTYRSWGRLYPTHLVDKFTVERFDKMYFGAVVAERFSN